MSEIDLKDGMAFYLFWLWEYIRRNQEYINDYNAFISSDRLEQVVYERVNIGLHSKSLPQERTMLKNEFVRKHGILPKDPSRARYNNAENILIAISDGTFSYSFSNTFDFNFYTINNAEPSVVLTNYFEVGDDNIRRVTNFKTFKIDMSKDIDDIKNEIEYLYHLLNNRHLAEFLFNVP